MRKRNIRLIALLLTAVLLFSGCDKIGYLPDTPDAYAEVTAVDNGGGSLWDRLGDLFGFAQQAEVVRFSDMEYSRPDMEAFEQLLLECCEIAREERNLDLVLETVYGFYDVYDRFYTDMALADIHYSRDLTDTYWEAEYNFCMENVGTVDAGLQELYYALAESPIRNALENAYFGKDFFLAYEGENLWDEAFLALLEEEGRLQNRYYELCAEAMEEEYYSEEYFARCSEPMTELLVELVRLRQEMAAALGYESYPEFAYDFYHYRDYKPAQAEAYLQEVGETLTDLYRKINESDVWLLSAGYCSEADMYRYVQTAAENMGGLPGEAFALLEDGELYDLSYGVNKLDTSFEVYLWSYYQPYVFVSPYKDQTDKLSFAHEFGHFLNDYVCYGSMAGTDVAEVHSQAMEYLSLLYAEDTEALEIHKMADCLYVYIEQAAYALFEQKLYALEGEDLTAENVQALYRQIGTQFGFDSLQWDTRDFVMVEHFYTNPMYIVSYVVSNDVALQIYQMEQAEAGVGLKVYQQCLESSDSYLLEFAEHYGLESPFAPGRLEKVRKTLEQELVDYL